jgi:NAD(P)-dependent dehydrogenase (short-subunit alcohol dehydrogenase family)
MGVAHAAAMRLTGKTAVVTGAAGNIGLATTRLFLKEGARVLLVDRDATALEQALDSFHPHFGPNLASGCVADVTDADAVRAYVHRAATQFGLVDVFFNNAGIEGPSARIAEFPEDGFDAVMAVNVRGVFLGMKYMAPVMRDGGSVIITSSIMGLKGSGGFVAYTASKHAVIGIMRDTAIDLSPRQIRVNSVHPGYVESDMLLRILRNARPGKPDAELLAAFAGKSRLGQCVSPVQVAEMVVFLASDESRMATGQTFVVDAGALL